MAYLSILVSTALMLLVYCVAEALIERYWPKPRCRICAVQKSNGRPKRR